MQNPNDPLLIEVDGKYFRLIVQDFEADIDIESYLKIDYSNILGELLTFPVIINQISNLKAELESLVSKQKLGIDILKANLEKQFKADYTGKATVAAVENHVTLNQEFQDSSNYLIHLQKQLRYLEGFYWSAQSKMDSLVKLTDKMQPSEFTSDVLEKTVNNVLIRRNNKL
jgi:hypothetical protein